MVISVEPDRVAMRAHAKINLALAVAPPIRDAGPRDGMHPIASWMAPIGLADEIEVARAAETSHTIEHEDGSPVAWDLDSDLAVRAHRALESAAGRVLPVSITVRKSIPAGGGLGGGSADAGAVLRAVNHVFGLGFEAERLRVLASELGSDIPFFIPADPAPATPLSGALVTGVGDVIESAPVRGAGPEPLTLILPPFGCPTGEVYRAFDRGLAGGSSVFRSEAVASIGRTGRVLPDALFNDLAGPAIGVRPALGTIRADLADGLGVPVHVSGSGSTLFCFGADADRARRLLPEGCVIRETSVLCCPSETL